ncbi:hypothetical protein MVEG_12365 [Podila verticillata NRRL 6337]|uniref:Heterokaryon incompatibility domain-containing protein n=1 Tax=Podila verticillata NRRL 6337 TaxID=1069443 RepID=A0A086TIK5_9FUNG|nr:hypothetical protein MVEG_12365 [Podila verticillata NRRL 6337]
MDNLCIDQEAKAEDKPLEIMGDIYRKCTECVCMLDTSCNVSEFTSERDLMVDVAKDVKESLENKEHISERYRDKYPHDNYVGKGHMGYISSILCADWFRRVWTWQEAALPPRVLFCSEYAGKYIYDPFDYEFLKDLFPYKFLELVDMNDRVECIIEEFGECTDDESSAEAAIGTISAISFIRPISELRRNLDIWDNIKLLTGSQRECTNEEDCVYGIMGVLNVHIPKGLELRDSVEVLNKELKKQGIFVGNTGYYKKSNSISDMYHIRHLYDGVRVLGKVDDITILGEFNPNVGIIDHTHGKILSKNYLESTDFHHKRGEKYENVHHEYTTETLVIRLETDRFNVGDMLELTKIGRRGCTFEHQHNSSDKDIFETIGNRVKIVGYTIEKIM